MSGIMPSLDSNRALELGAAAGAGLAAFLAYSWKTNAPWLHPARKDTAESYQGGESYGDPKLIATGLLEDLKAIGFKAAHSDLHTLLDVFMAKGKPVDDKLMTMEKLIAITASLPPTSKTRAKLTNTIVDTLWDSLQHPPLSYLGDKFQYRTPDGSYNNVLNPKLGAAGTAYAKTVRSAKKLQGVKPDPGLLFDLLLGREEGHFKENPAGISSVLFYHATIIIHDIFRTNRLDTNISDTSSYLDLAPLYGSSLEDQLKIRTMEKGLLKPDTFSEKRLLAQPPGINVMLVMYSRFHNYVANILLQINENGRFTLEPYDEKDEAEKKAAIAKQDNDLFQTARLIVGGLYINICLHDYLRGLTNTHHSPSSWTLDPRIDIDKHFDGEGVPRGIGNQVSAEFNLLYRFHSTISLRDEKWLNDFFMGIFPDIKKPLNELTPEELLRGLVRFEQMTPIDPSKREFGGIKRGPDGKFKDEDLVKIIKESTEDPAGLFGARMVPKALRVVEILGILQARKWQVASLNEFRDFFGLKRHETMEDINPDPEIADLLRNLYHHPDMVELYPGLFVEEAKPRLDPGCGGCPPYTVGRAVFSDAVTLVRSDRFYTLDYTTATLTNWGMAEVQQDYKTLGGSMLYKLFQRGVPNWFPYNSLHIMQPMFTRKMNEQIATEIGTIADYTLDDPSPPRPPVILTKHALICSVLKDQNAFKVPWLKALNDLFPGKKDYSGFMLGADKPINTAQRNLVGDILYGPAEIKKLLADFVLNAGFAQLKSETFALTKSLNQIDIIRDIAIPVNTRLLADLFALDLITPENPQGTHTTSELYKALLDVRVWGFNNNDPGLAWNRRRWAREGATALTKSSQSVVAAIAAEKKPIGYVEKLVTSLGMSHVHKKDLSKEGSLRWYGRHVARQLLTAGKTVEETADICWLTALAGVGVPVGMFAEIMQFFLATANQAHWAKLQDLAAANNSEADKIIRQYVLEAQRLTSGQRNLRICAETTTIDGKTFNKGDAVVCLLGPAGKDVDVVSEPALFKTDRPADCYIHFGFGPHQCLGREVTLSYCVGLVKVVAGLKNLRPAPGDMGLLRTVQVGTERCYLTDNWATLTFDPTTWTLHYDGIGKGVYQPPNPPVTTGRDLNAVAKALFKEMKKAREDREKAAASGVNAISPAPPGPIPATANGTPSGATTAKSLTCSEVIGLGNFSTKQRQGNGGFNVTFATPYAKPPRIFYGLKKINLANHTDNPRLRTVVKDVTTAGFNIDIQTWGSSILEEAECTWLEIPDNEAHADFQLGTISTANHHPWHQPQTATSQAIKFSKPFTEPPEITIWLSGYDFPQKPEAKIKAYATNITASGFDLNIDTNPGIQLYGGVAQWLAIPKVPKVEIQTADFGETFTTNVQDGKGSVRTWFDHHPAGTPVRCSAALNTIHYVEGSNQRVELAISNPTTTSADWKISSWDNTKIKEFGATYVALPLISGDKDARYIDW
ncbi:MAG: hypothetical protein M1829_004617 [Trizodia sp. TS-e1964]|nr:MAG: hypothetical protein M1829_004617 [Trizodia sp. TS-e1964]